jgi:hypothetical protein
LFHPAVVILPAGSAFGEGDRVVPAPEEEGIVDELAAAVTVDGVEGEEETVSGILKGFFDPFVSLVSQRVIDSPAGSHIGHGESVAKRSRGVAAIMLNQVNLEESGRLEGAFPVGQYGNPLFQGRPGLRAVPFPDFQFFCV